MPSAQPTPARENARGLLEERATSEGLLLALVGQHAMRRLRAAHIEHKLSPRQFHLLGLLHDRGAMTQRELGTLMDVDPSILVTLLNPLEAGGYLSRERDPTDRRRHVVTLTPAGRRQLDRAAQAQRDAEAELFAALTDTQRDQLRGLLLVLREQLTPEHNDACTSPDAAEPT
ncbi:MAG TPA: MarR family transcriptional regulator [Gaiellaceae bacterium]|jgi:DNA-binding MarR family transcriptional regulator|nr:MarR family transcriptional regulator [Gaiellaceae bacterium]